MWLQVPQKACTVPVKALSQATLCQQPSPVCSNGHVETCVIGLKWKSNCHCPAQQEFQTPLCLTCIKTNSLACCNEAYQYVICALLHSSLKPQRITDSDLWTNDSQRSLLLLFYHKAENNSVWPINLRSGRSIQQNNSWEIVSIREQTSSWLVVIRPASYRCVWIELHKSWGVKPFNLWRTCDLPDPTLQYLPAAFPHDAFQPDIE